MAKQKKDNKKESKQVENEKVCAILSYLVVGIIWYFADEKMKRSEFAKFHTKQGLVLFILGLIVSVIYNIPVIGWWVLGPVLHLCWVVLLIIGIINAANDEEKELPLVGQFGEKFNF